MAARLLDLLYDWPELSHHVRHNCGFIVPGTARFTGSRACNTCGSGWIIETYNDIWIWS